MILVTIFLLFGCIQQIAAIQCYKCQEYGDHCSLPFTIEGGEEHNENDIPSIEYDPDYVCESDHLFDPKTRQERLILRGTKYCEPLNVPNHRRHCCYSDNCNREPPLLTIQPEFSNNGIFFNFPTKKSIFIGLIFLYTANK